MALSVVNRVWRGAAAVVGVACLAACGGGGGTTASSSAATVPSSSTGAVAAEAEIPAAPVLSDAVSNGSFESPVLAAGEHRTLPTDVAGWTFTGSAALSATDSRFSSGVGTSGAGSQMVALQNDSAISQVLRVRPGDELRFRAIQRQNHSTGDQILAVFVDGVQQGDTLTPTRNDGWRLHRVTLTMAGMAEGDHRVEIRGMTSGEGVDQAALIDAVQVVPAATALTSGKVVNEGFEVPSLAAGTYAYRPEGATGWLFSGAAAVSGNDSQFTVQAPTAVEGNQVAVLQMNATLKQTLGLLPGDKLVFQATPRLNYGLGLPQALGVYVGGHRQVLRTDLSTAAGKWTEVAVPLTSVLEAGRYEVEIRSEVAPPYNDTSVFIDQVSVQRLTF